MKNLLILFLALLCFELFAQKNVRYDFSSRSEVYIPLDAKAKNLSENNIWDDDYFILDLGFEMDFIGEKTKRILFDSYGVLSSENAYDSTLEVATRFISLFSDFADLGRVTRSPESPILFEVSGPVGNKVATLELKNTGFFSDHESNVDFANVQFKFFQKDNAVEIHFGPSQIDNPEDSFDDLPGPIIGAIYSLTVDLRLMDLLIDSCLLVQGSPSLFTGKDYSKKLSFIDDTSIYFHGWPLPNQIFRFGPHINTASIDVSKTNSIYVSSNPFSKTCTLKNVDLIGDINNRVSIQNVQGKIVSPTSYNLQYESSTLQLKLENLESMPDGIYFILLNTVDGQKAIKIIKED